MTVRQISNTDHILHLVVIDFDIANLLIIIFYDQKWVVVLDFNFVTGESIFNFLVKSSSVHTANVTHEAAFSTSSP
jgi:hypothetical protein